MRSEETFLMLPHEPPVAASEGLAFGSDDAFNAFARKKLSMLGLD